MNLFDNFEIGQEGIAEGQPITPCNPDRPDGAGNGKYPSLAMVYSPHQDFRDLYEPADALAHGTLYRELFKPFEAYTWGGKN